LPAQVRHAHRPGPLTWPAAVGARLRRALPGRTQRARSRARLGAPADPDHPRRLAPRLPTRAVPPGTLSLLVCIVCAWRGSTSRFRMSFWAG
jgi:hypothetical protein